VADYYEIDFLGVETDKSGDAIPLRYELSGQTFIHVVDGGFPAEGERVVAHINEYYGKPRTIDHVICTHPDADHAGGLRAVLETFKVGTLWMNRPWIYADELLPRFAKFTNVDNLRRRLREVYPNLVALEEIALRLGINIQPAFQGTPIGVFVVMTPTRARFLDLIVESERTPESIDEVNQDPLTAFADAFAKTVKTAVAYLRSAWGEEVFPPGDTSAENAMSIVQYAKLCGDTLLLTADTGRYGLLDVVNYARHVGLILPGLSRVQVPHHGSRHNVSTETLDLILGPRHATQQELGSDTPYAVVSSAKADEAHPRRSVVRAFMHRGYRVFPTEGSSIHVKSSGAPARNWGKAIAMTYPEEQEDAR